MKFCDKILVLALLVTCSVASDDTPKCTPGEVKMKDCNRCHCSPSNLWACTRRACPVKPAVNEPGFKCQPNQPFMDDCNTCTCDSSGTLARCTQMLCDPNERQKRESPKLKPNCVPGTTWMKECNRCWCSETGFAACTLMGCLRRSDLHPSRGHHEDKIQGGLKNNHLSSEVLVPKRHLAESQNRLEENRAQRQKRDVDPAFSMPVQGGDTVDPAFSMPVQGGNLVDPEFSMPAQGSETVDTAFSMPVKKPSDRVDHSFSMPVQRQKRADIKEKSNKQSQPAIGLNYQSPLSPIDPVSTPKSKNQGTKSQSPASSVASTPKTTVVTTKKPHDYGTTSGKTYTPEEVDSDDFRCTPNESFKVSCNTCWCDVSGKGVRYCTRIACKPKTYPPLNPV